MRVLVKGGFESVMHLRVKGAEWMTRVRVSGVSGV